MGKRNRHNIEVQVALLRADLFKSDLAKLLGMHVKTFDNRFGHELPAELQKKLIKLIECVASGNEPTAEDARNYYECCDEMRLFSEKTQDEIDDRTIAFVEHIEADGSKYNETLEMLNETFHMEG